MPLEANFWSKGKLESDIAFENWALIKGFI